MDAFSRGDFDAALAHFDPDVVWEVAPEITPDAAAHRGHDGVRRFWDQWHDHFATFELEIVECRVIEDGRVLAITRAHGVGAGSGVELTSPEFAQVFDFRGTTVVRVRLRGGR